MFGYVVLYSWPIVVWALFNNCSKPIALLVSIIVGYLFLPAGIGIDFPGLPVLHKDTIPAIAAFFFVLVVRTKNDWTPRPRWIPQMTLPRVLIVTLLGTPFLTVITNGDALFYGPRVVPALRPWDAFSEALTVLMTLLPLILGRKLLASPDQQRLFSITLIVAGMIYSFLALYEVRMSPQLNNIVYGFFPHSWVQHIRGDGFRPIVFLPHGLWLSIFFSATVLAAFGQMRMSVKKTKLIYLGLGSWLLMTLILTKSLGALVITLVLLPVVLFMTIRSQLIVATALATIVFVYPMLRGADLIPVERIMEWAESVSDQRAESLKFRLDNEDLLLEKAQERPLFGWGKWGRNFVVDADGVAVSSVADGYWILVVGQKGWVGYLSEFGLLCLTAFVAFFRSRRYQLGLETSVLILILVGNLVDLIPNATITPLTWLLAGAIWGRLELGDMQEAGTKALLPPQYQLRAPLIRSSKEARIEPSQEAVSSAPPTYPDRLRYTRQTTRIERRKRDE